LNLGRNDPGGKKGKVAMSRKWCPQGMGGTRKREGPGNGAQKEVPENRPRGGCMLPGGGGSLITEAKGNVLGGGGKKKKKKRGTGTFGRDAGPGKKKD